MGTKTILSTTNYAMFKTHDANRELDSQNLRKITDSISAKNHLERRPILVDKNMQVIDGQHRLEAAKKLQIPVFYMVDDELDITDIFLLNNNQKSWSGYNYLNYYCSVGKESYVRFESFMLKNNLTLTEAQILLFGNRGGKTYKEFKEGRFIYPTVKEQEILDKYMLVLDIVESTNFKAVKKLSFLDNMTARMALMKFVSVPEYDHDTFLKKIEIKIDALHICASIESYYQMFKSIYNYKNQKPLD